MLIKNKYGLLLVALICFILFSPLTSESFIGKLSFAFLFVFTIVGVARGTAESVFHCWLLAILGVIAIACNLLSGMDLHVKLFGKAAGLAFFGSAIWQFGKDIFLRNKADIDTLFGAICIYLLIGTIFAMIYSVLQMLIPGSFIFSADHAALTRIFDYYYFSFITLTTTGFGDIVPNAQFARAFVMVESVTGIFYLGILVAHLAMYLGGKE